MTLYLEQYLDSLQSLPSDLQRNLKLLREHDEKANQGLRDIDRLTKAYIKSSGGKGFSKEARSKKYDEIQELFKDIRALGDDKVLLGGQTYEMVDKHIRRLDADLARFENDIKRRFLEGKTGRSSPDEDTKKTPKNRKALATPKGTSKKRKLNLDESLVASKKKKKKGEECLLPSTSVIDGLDPEEIASLSGPALFQQLAGVTGGEVMDMPVDPNEPTYCLCHQVSYGEMVGCDNSECPIEWFHFSCVNLTTKPKGKWFCPRCSEERRKKNH